jgi:hypothetical protein
LNRHRSLPDHVRPHSRSRTYCKRLMVNVVGASNS